MEILSLTYSQLQSTAPAQMPASAGTEAKTRFNYYNSKIKVLNFSCSNSKQKKERKSEFQL